MSDSLASAAVKNPMFRNMMFNALAGTDEEEATQSSSKSPAAAIEVSQEEITKIKKWAMYLKYGMIGVSTLMIICSWYNLANSANSVATNFLAFYLFFFSIMICCFELALTTSITMLIVQNFGFMYNPVGRILFLVFISVLCFQLSSLGKAVFAILLLAVCIQIYVYVAHPQYQSYMEKLHYFGKVKSNIEVSTQV